MNANMNHVHLIALTEYSMLFLKGARKLNAWTHPLPQLFKSIRFHKKEHLTY